MFVRSSRTISSSKYRKYNEKNKMKEIIDYITHKIYKIHPKLNYITQRPIINNDSLSTYQNYYSLTHSQPISLISTQHQRNSLFHPQIFSHLISNNPRSEPSKPLHISSALTLITRQGDKHHNDIYIFIGFLTKPKFL